MSDVVSDIIAAGVTNHYLQMATTATTANGVTNSVMLFTEPVAPLPEHECGYCRQPVVVHIEGAHWSWSHLGDGTPLCAGPDGVAWLASIWAGRVTVDAVNNGGMW